MFKKGTSSRTTMCTCVNSSVATQVGAIGEGFPALPASVGFPARVCTEVSPQLWALLELLIARAATVDAVRARVYVSCVCLWNRG